MIIQSYLFVLYSIDINESRMHIHVESRKGKFRISAKWWLEPEIQLATKGNFSAKEIKRIEKLIFEHSGLLVSQIEKFS